MFGRDPLSRLDRLRFDRDMALAQVRAVSELLQEDGLELRDLRAGHPPREHARLGYVKKWDQRHCIAVVETRRAETQKELQRLNSKAAALRDLVGACEARMAEKAR